MLNEMGKAQNPGGLLEDAGPAVSEAAGEKRGKPEGLLPVPALGQMQCAAHLPAVRPGT